MSIYFSHFKPPFPSGSSDGIFLSSWPSVTGTRTLRKLHGWAKIMADIGLLYPNSTPQTTILAFIWVPKCLGTLCNLLALFPKGQFGLYLPCLISHIYFILCTLIQYTSWYFIISWSPQSICAHGRLCFPHPCPLLIQSPLKVVVKRWTVSPLSRDPKSRLHISFSTGFSICHNMAERF